jgi:hypothetical protein
VECIAPAPVRRQFVFRQQSVDAEDRLLVTAVAMHWSRQALCARDNELKGRNAASRALFHIRFRRYSLLPAVAQFRAPFTT